MDENIPVITRKYHYWRGFKAALLITVPIILALMYGLTIALDAMQGVQ